VPISINGLVTLSPEGDGDYLAITGLPKTVTSADQVGITLTFTYADNSTTTVRADLPVDTPLTPPVRSTPAPPSAD
jgi:hypothetical protein